MSEEDSGLPEEESGKLDQTNSVPVQGVGPWKNENDMWTFQNVDDVYEYGKDVATADLTIVLVLDNADAIDLYPQHKHYWVIDVYQYEGDNDDTLRVQHLTEYYIVAREDGQELDGFVDWFRTNVDSSYVKMDSYQGAPVLVRSSAYDDSRPATQTDSTTGANGNSVVTTTNLTDGAATADTESEVIPANVSGADDEAEAQRIASGRQAISDTLNDAANRYTEFIPGENAANAYDDAILRQARGLGTVSDISAPCLPNTQGTGAGSNGASSGFYEDAILRRARANGASPSSSGDGQQTSPTTVTGNDNQQNNNSTNNQSRPPSVYIYEPMTPGFDRYDFNSGKKVYTPDVGPSRNSSSQQTNASTTPTAAEARATENTRVSNVLAARASGANIGF